MKVDMGVLDSRPALINLSTVSVDVKQHFNQQQKVGRQVLVMLNVLGCQLTYWEQAETNAEAWFNIALRPRKPEKARHVLGRTAQDGHLDSHTAPELW